MSAKCAICLHPDRAEIENAILAVAPGSSITLEKIAEEYGVELNQLKMHAMFHAPLLTEFDKQVTEQTTKDGETITEEAPTSLVRKMKLREADILSTTSNEYLVTLKSMGRRMNKLIGVTSIDAEDANKQLELAKLLTKPMVDLYIGLGNEIRQNVKAMAELDRLLNGPQDNGTDGLTALAAAIRGSGGDNQ